MIRFRNVSIRKQFVLIIGIAILMVTLTQVLYFLKLSKVVENKTKIYSQDILTQINENLRIKFAGVKKASYTISYSLFVQEYMTSSNISEKLKLNKYITDSVNSIASFNEDVDDIVIVDLTENVSSFKGIIDNSLYKYIKEQYRFSDINYLESRYFYIPGDKDDWREAYYAYVVPIFNINPTSKAKSKIGTTIVLSKMSHISKIINIVTVTERAIFIIVDESGNMVASNKNELINKSYNDIAFKGEFNKKQLITSMELPETGWSLISLIPSRQITKDLDFFQSFGLYVGLVIIIVLMLIGITFNQNITRPIMSLVKSINNVNGKHIKQRIEVQTKNEIGNIANHINLMLDKVEYMTKKEVESQKKVYEIEISRKKSQLYALQSQINPHFLYNTLQCVRGIAISRDVYVIAEIASAMSDIFRYAIKGENMVMVGEELNIINQYLKIIEVRFNGRYKAIIDVDAGILSAKIEKMILQPIVENAVYHGLESKEGEGNIYIRGRVEGETILLEVEDDGAGITEERLIELQKGLEEEWGELDIEKNTRSIGLININNRIKLYLGKEFGVTVSSIFNKGTKVTIKIPCIK